MRHNPSFHNPSFNRQLKATLAMMESFTKEGLPKLVQQKIKAEEEQQRKAEEEKKRVEEKRKAEEERRKVEEERRSEEQKRRVEEERKKVEEERRIEEQKRKAEEERKWVEEERRKAEEEHKRKAKAEEERMKSEERRRRVSEQKSKELKPEEKSFIQSLSSPQHGIFSTRRRDAPQSRSLEHNTIVASPTPEPDQLVNPVKPSGQTPKHMHGQQLSHTKRTPTHVKEPIVANTPLNMQTQQESLPSQNVSPSKKALPTHNGAQSPPGIIVPTQAANKQHPTDHPLQSPTNSKPPPESTAESTLPNILFLVPEGEKEKKVVKEGEAGMEPTSQPPLDVPPHQEHTLPPYPPQMAHPQMMMAPRHPGFVMGMGMPMPHPMWYPGFVPIQTVLMPPMMPPHPHMMAAAHMISGQAHNPPSMLQEQADQERMENASPQIELVLEDKEVQEPESNQPPLEEGDAVDDAKMPLIQPQPSTPTSPTPTTSIEAITIVESETETLAVENETESYATPEPPQLTHEQEEKQKQEEELEPPVVFPTAVDTDIPPLLIEVEAEGQSLEAYDSSGTSTSRLKTPSGQDQHLPLPSLPCRGPIGSQQGGNGSSRDHRERSDRHYQRPSQDRRYNKSGGHQYSQKRPKMSSRSGGGNSGGSGGGSSGGSSGGNSGGMKGGRRPQKMVYAQDRGGSRQGDYNRSTKESSKGSTVKPKKPMPSSSGSGSQDQTRGSQSNVFEADPSIMSLVEGPYLPSFHTLYSSPTTHDFNIHDFITPTQACSSTAPSQRWAENNPSPYLYSTTSLHARLPNEHLKSSDPGRLYRSRTFRHSGNW